MTKTGHVILGINMDETEDWYYGGTFFGGDLEKAATFPDPEAAASMIEFLTDAMEGVELLLIHLDEAKERKLAGSETGASS
jgi:hypothetical protein